MEILNKYNLISEKVENLSRFAPVVVRVALSLVFLWFGSQQLLHTSSWTGLVPAWVASTSGLSTATLVQFNGIFEVVFGIFLLLGFFTRLSALLLALHLFNIMSVVGYNDIGVRDFGLAMATLSVFLYGADAWTVDKKFAER